MTRGSLTTFSIANDIAKYFAIIPPLFLGLYPELQKLNIMKLSSPESAILSAVIYNALIIIALIPLALKGVKYREVPASKLLSRNLLVYGLGGIIQKLNIMKLSSPESAILSAVIYNALIIIALIPLALKGVKYREVPASKLLSRNLLVYGLGGIIAPFIAIKIIDIIITMLGLV